MALIGTGVALVLILVFALTPLQATIPVVVIALAFGVHEYIHFRRGS